MGPPLTTMAGILSLPAAISIPGVTLSQLVKSTMASKPCAVTISSIRSAIISRLSMGIFIPLWPVAIPSQTAMQGNSSGVPPASATPSLIAWQSGCRWTWPGISSLKELTTATRGLSRSSRQRPME